MASSKAVHGVGVCTARAAPPCCGNNGTTIVKPYPAAGSHAGRGFYFSGTSAALQQPQSVGTTELQQLQQLQRPPGSSSVVMGGRGDLDGDLLDAP